MIETLIIDPDSGSVKTLEQQLSTYCPVVRIRGVACSLERANQMMLVRKPDLLFIDIDVISKDNLHLWKNTSDTSETIFLVSSPLQTIQEVEAHSRSTYLTRPIQAPELFSIVTQVKNWIQLKKEQAEFRNMLMQLIQQTPPNNVIRIPTMEGMEFLKAVDIIRCEGLQQFTKVVVADAANIISSYNIGKFCDLLVPYGFFAPHRSHLINLQFVRKYVAEGTIIMRDGSNIPVSRRRKGLFLQQIKHL